MIAVRAILIVFAIVAIHPTLNVPSGMAPPPSVSWGSYLIAFVLVAVAELLRGHSKPDSKL